ncbi:MAG TPA: saccharopine dehydrogenase C-terminal domain-containing protein [Acidobacteriota bacterium]
MPKVLVLGAGLVAKPLVDYLLQVPEFEVEVADLLPSKAQALVAGRTNGRAVALDIDDEGRLAALVASADLAVSLVPQAFHPRVAKYCLEKGKHLVTASYAGQAMRALDAEAKARALIFLNEVGLDPGIDHMEAMRIIHLIKSQGGRVEAFISYCGGLPAPEANTNPFGYKFSWSPLGVLLASKGAARYLWDGREVIVSADKLFDNPAIMNLEGLGTLEGYPNRDSMSYLETYGLSGAKTILRGTLRYPGWCRTLKRIKELNLLDEAEEDFKGTTLREFLSRKMGLVPGQEPAAALRSRFQDPEDREVLDRLEWLGLTSDQPVAPGTKSGLQAMTALMSERLCYAPAERDLIVLRHEICAVYPDGNKERFVSTLIDFGQPGGDSAMARTVGLPAAICARLILEERIKERGVLLPTFPGIYAPVLQELQSFGISFKEKREPAR